MHTKKQHRCTHTHTNKRTSRPLLLVLWLVFDLSGNGVLKETWPLCWQDCALSPSCTTPACTGDCSGIVRQLLWVQHCMHKCEKCKTGGTQVYTAFPITQKLVGFSTRRLLCSPFVVVWCALCKVWQNSFRTSFEIYERFGVDVEGVHPRYKLTFI